MLAASGTALAFPGAAWSMALWSLRPVVRDQLTPLGWPVIALFYALAGVFAYTSVNWFRKLRIGWMIASALIAVNLLGDIIELLSGRLLEGLPGIILGGTLFAYMMSPWIRGVFSSEKREN